MRSAVRSTAIPPRAARSTSPPRFATNGFEAPRQVIDVSGDGAENTGADTSDARDAALLAGIDAINGLPILGESGLLAFYQNNIQGGVNSFTVPIDSFNDFAAAIEQKLIREIRDVPEPGTLAVLGVALLGLGAIRRRKAA